MSKVIVGMSGGIDSSFAAYILKRKGLDVMGAFLNFSGSRNPEKLEKIQAICKILDIPLAVADCSDLFASSVITPFIESYLSGFTPNPCVICNANVKFKVLIDLACKTRSLFVASGHYAKISESSDGSFSIRRGDDIRKDQSYMLYRLKHKWFPKLLFPLGSWEKRKLQQEAVTVFGNIFNGEKESQDICFINGKSHDEFIMDEIGPSADESGTIIDVEGNILGEYNALFRYTIGQRKGLNLSGGPWFVLSMDPVGRKIIVGPEESLFPSIINCTSPVWHDNVFIGEVLHAQHRYRTQPVKVRISSFGKDCFSVDVLGKMRAPAPGQSLVLYRADELVGGGIITSAEE